MSFLGRIFPRDVLSISKQPAVKVLCTACREHVFYMKRENGGTGLDNLVPLAGAHPPHDSACPKCGRIFLAFSPEPSLLTDRGYISK